MSNSLDLNIKPVRISGDEDAWRKGLSSVFVELEFKQADSQTPLVGTVYRYPFGDLTFIRAITRGGQHSVVRSQAMIEQSSHNNFFVACLLKGSAELKQREHTAILEKGDLAILDSTQEYTIEVPQSIDAIWVRVPRHRIEGRLAPLNQLMAERINGTIGVGHLASIMLRTALTEAPQISALDANRITNSLLDLLGMSLSGAHARTPAFTRSSQSTLRRLQQYIEDHLDNERLSLENIALAHSISVRYINKLFMREGVSAARWIRMRRLELCRADLEDPEKRDRSVSEIAFSHGFGNISSFNRAFKSRFHVAPTRLRNGV